MALFLRDEQGGEMTSNSKCEESVEEKARVPAVSTAECEKSPSPPPDPYDWDEVPQDSLEEPGYGPFV